MGYAIIDEELARLIKVKLWNGVKQEEVAEECGVTQGHISHISTGRQWEWIEWPDGSTGGMAAERRRELHKRGKRQKPSSNGNTGGSASSRSKVAGVKGKSVEEIAAMVDKVRESEDVDTENDGVEEKTDDREGYIEMQRGFVYSNDRDKSSTRRNQTGGKRPRKEKA